APRAGEQAAVQPAGSAAGRAGGSATGRVVAAPAAGPPGPGPARAGPGPAPGEEPARLRPGGPRRPAPGSRALQLAGAEPSGRGCLAPVARLRLPGAGPGWP